MDEAYAIRNKDDEILLFTLAHWEADCVLAFMRMKGQTRKELYDEGYRMCRVSIEIVDRLILRDLL